MLVPIFICILSLSLLYLSACAVPEISQGSSLQEPPFRQTINSFSKKRQQMISTQIQKRGIKNKAVIEAMSQVPRHRFVDASLAHLAYIDSPLPIGYRQTISQPYIVAYMSEMADITSEEKVLEIGTGSGYQAAVIGELAQEVYTIEIIPELAQNARQILKELGYDNVHVKTGDGYQGWPEYAPYDAILVTAAPEQIPSALVEQLALNGRMIIPVGKEYQAIVIITKTPDGLKKQRTIPVRFVPMTTNSEP